MVYFGRSVCERLTKWKKWGHPVYPLLLSSCPTLCRNKRKEFILNMIMGRRVNRDNLCFISLQHISPEETKKPKMKDKRIEQSKQTPNHETHCRGMLRIFSCCKNECTLLSYPKTGKRTPLLFLGWLIHLGLVMSGGVSSGPFSFLSPLAFQSVVGFYSLHGATLKYDASIGILEFILGLQLHWEPLYLTYQLISPSAEA